MSQKGFYGLLAGLNLVFAGMGIFFFFSGIDFSANQAEGGKKIGVSYMTMDQSYYEVLNNAVSSVVEERGDILLVRNPSMDARKQEEQIEELMEEGIEALFLMPVDWQQITPVLQKAKEKGIIVIAVDSLPYMEELVDCAVTSDNYDAGVQLARYLMVQAASADIILLEQPGVQSYMERIQGFSDTIKDMSDYRIQGTYTYNGKMDSAMETMEMVCQDGITFDTVFAVSDVGAMGAIAELEQSESGEIRVLSVDGSPEGKQMIRKKCMLATMAQFPTDLGKQAAEAMYQIMEGEVCDRHIEISVKLISRYTIESYDTEKWQ